MLCYVMGPEMRVSLYQSASRIQVKFCTPLLKSVRLNQGRSDGGYMGIYTPKSVQVNFLWDKNDVRTAIEHEY